MQNAENERIVLIDVARGIGIVCVLSGHLLGEGGMSFAHSDTLYGMIYRFHMPLFFLISGLLLGRREQYSDFSISSIPNMCWKLTKGLLLPYVLWHLIYFGISDIDGSQRIEDWVPTIITLRGGAPLWFLSALFLSEITVIIVVCIFKKKEGRICALGMLMFLTCAASYIWRTITLQSIYLNFLVLTLFRNFACATFLLSGVLLSKVILKPGSKPVNIFLSLICGVILLDSIQWEEKVNLHIFNIGNPMAFFLYGIAGAMMVIFVSKTAVESFMFKSCTGLMKIKDVFQNITRNLGMDSLGIMVFHYPPFPFIRYSKLIQQNICNGIPSFLEFCVALLLLIVSSELCTGLVKKKLFL